MATEDWIDCLTQLGILASEFDMRNIFAYLQSSEVNKTPGQKYDMYMILPTKTVDSYLKQDFKVDFSML